MRLSRQSTDHGDRSHSNVRNAHLGPSCLNVVPRAITAKATILTMEFTFIDCKIQRLNIYSVYQGPRNEAYHHSLIQSRSRVDLIILVETALLNCVETQPSETPHAHTSKVPLLLHQIRSGHRPKPMVIVSPQEKRMHISIFPATSFRARSPRERAKHSNILTVGIIIGDMRSHPSLAAYGAPRSYGQSTVFLCATNSICDESLQSK